MPELTPLPADYANRLCARSQAPAWECSLGSSSFLSSLAKLELRVLGSQAGAWEPALTNTVTGKIDVRNVAIPPSGADHA